jgi:hypothetical protein
LLFWRVCDASPASRVSVSAGSFLFLEAFLGIFVLVVMAFGKELFKLI